MTRIFLKRYNMKNKLYRLLAALLLACMLLSSVSCAVNTPEETTTPVTEIPAETTAPEITFSITEDYYLVRPDETDQTEVQAIQLLSRGITSAYGFRCLMTTDFKKPSEEVKPNEFEILIGKTNRAESIEVSADLAYYEWVYKVYSENVIVICGGSPEATLAAAHAFLKDVIGYEEDAEQNILSAGSAAEIKIPTEKGYIHDYPVKTITICGRDIAEYSIVTSSENNSGIDTVVGGISRICGKNLPVVTLEGYKGGPAIFFGCAKPDGSHYESSIYGNNRYYITESDGNFFIDFKSKSTGESAAERFVSEFFPEDAIGELTVTPEKGNVITGLHIKSGINGLVLDESSEKVLAEGITYVEELYLDKDGAPVRAYAVIIKKGAASIQTTMPSDSAEKIGSVSNMKNQLTAAINNGKNVIAGVNADFFDMGGTNIMRGLCVKDGVEIHPVSDRPWFGITQDGDAVMGEASDYRNYKGKLMTAVGGSNIILKRDSVVAPTGTDFADTRHPRTAAGVTADGTLVLLVVDGRQPAISNGASLCDLAFIFARYGCIDAVNLDGGGSSTFIIKEDSALVTKNSPSAGSLRAVADGLMVILP